MTTPLLKQLRAQNDDYQPSKDRTGPSGSPIATGARPPPPVVPQSARPNSPSIMGSVSTSKSANWNRKRPLPRPPPVSPKGEFLRQRHRPPNPDRSKPPASYAKAMEDVAADRLARAERQFPDISADLPSRPSEPFEPNRAPTSSFSTRTPQKIVAPSRTSVSPSITVSSPTIDPKPSTSSPALPSFSFGNEDDAPKVQDSSDLPRILRGMADISVRGRGDTTSSIAASLVCAGCGRPIAGRILAVLGRRWHPDCFQCVKCGLLLEHVAFHEKEGQAYCHVDYHELFSVRCDHCKTPIIDESYVTIDDPSLGKRSYHELHFFCSNCGDPFIEPKSLSDRRVEPKPYIVHEGYAYCDRCDIQLHRPRCRACKKPIEGDVVKAMGKQWHDTCFVCESCGNPFLDDTFFVKGENTPYCKNCYTVQLRSEL